MEAGMGRQARKMILITLAAAALLCACAGAAAESGPEDAYRAAPASFGGGDYAQAGRLFAEAGAYADSAVYLAECNRLLAPVTINNAYARERIVSALAAEGMAVSGEVSAWQAEALTALDLSGCALYDVGFLEAFTGLETLSIADNAVADLYPLRGLYRLETLDASGNRIEDITPLYNLTALTALSLAGNSVERIDVLGSLVNLRTLDLSGNAVVSVATLQSLSRLEALDISENYVAYLNPLGGLTALRKLDISNNKVESVLAIRTLANLEELDVSSHDDEALALQKTNYMYVPPPDNYQVADLTVIAGFTKLKKLNIAGNGLSDIGPLAALTRLEELDMSYNYVCSFEALRGLTNLRILKADELGGEEWRYQDAGYEYGVFNHVAKPSTLEPLAGLTKLEYVSVADNLITDLTPLANLQNLQTLLLPNDDDLERRYDLADLSPLAGHTALKNLNFDYRYVTSLAPLYASVNLEALSLDTCTGALIEELSAFPHLKSLNLTRMTVPSLDVLSGLQELETLDLSNCSTGTEYRLSLKPLRHLQKLKSLTLYGCGGREYVYLMELTALEELYIDSYDIHGEVNIMPMLGMLPNLKALDMSGMTFTDIGSLAALTSLETLKIKLSGPENLNALRPLTRLRMLLIRTVGGGETELSDISALSAMKDLRDVAISDGTSAITDISALAACTQLDAVRIDNAQIEDISPLQACAKLTFISFANNRIRDLSVLAALPLLEDVQVPDNPLTDISALAGHPYLTSFDIERDPVKDISVIMELPSLGDVCLEGVRYKKTTQINNRLKEIRSQ